MDIKLECKCTITELVAIQKRIDELSQLEICATCDFMNWKWSRTETICENPIYEQKKENLTAAYIADDKFEENGGFYYPFVKRTDKCEHYKIKKEYLKKELK